MFYYWGKTKFLLLRRVFSHDQDDLRGYENLRYRVLLVGERVVGKFLVTVILVHSTKDCLFFVNTKV